MSELVEVIKEISRVMGEVIEADLPLYMSEFFQDLASENNPTIHACRTGACVIGYCALDSKIVSTLEIDGYLDLESIANEFHSKLEALSYPASESITGYNACNRIQSAMIYLEKKGIDVNDIEPRPNHLYEDDTTPQDAKYWIDYVISIESGMIK